MREPNSNILNYPKNMQEPFWNMEKVRKGIGLQEQFMNEIKQSAKLAEFKYPKEDGYKVMWAFKHSSCHGAYSEDAYKMNVKPGGKQPKMRDAVWQGRVQRLVF